LRVRVGYRYSSAGTGIPVFYPYIFAIPATQNRSERAFSGADHIMTDLRTNLDPEHLNELLLLRSYHKLQLQDSLDTSSQGSEDSD
jgi:hAT family C-terminal dimerisation region